jgi:phage baseplate assembly protein W
MREMLYLRMKKSDFSNLISRIQTPQSQALKAMALVSASATKLLRAWEARFLTSKLIMAANLI